MAGFANTFGPSKSSSQPPRDAFHTQAIQQVAGGPYGPAKPPEPAGPKQDPFAKQLFNAGPVTVTTPGQTNPTPAPSFRSTYNGKVYTDPNALAQAQAAQAFQPVQYNGQTYTDPHQYANAIITDAKSQHDQALKQINEAHAQGLISFDQQQQLIDQSRKSSQDQISGYFNQISPDAIQSQQGVMAADSNKQFDQSAQQLGANKGSFETNFQNSVQSADKALQNTTDQANNAVTANQATVQGILDAGQNAATDFKNQSSAYRSASAPTTTQFDPVNLAQNFVGYLQNAQQVGIPLDQARVSLQNQLKSQGFNEAQTSPLIDYIYGQINNPQSTIGQSFLNKSPLSLYSPGQ